MSPGSDPLVILGGSFDPVHNGHLNLVRSIHRLLQPLRLYLIPCFHSPHREQLPRATPTQRLKMLDLAIHTLGLAGVEVDARELERGKISYTFDTVRELRAEVGPEIPVSVCLGADVWPGFYGWHRCRQLLREVQILLMPRQHSISLSTVPRLASRQQLLAGSPGDIWRLDCRMRGESSTSIRTRTAAGGRPPPDTVPPAVADYIAATQLYQ